MQSITAIFAGDSGDGVQTFGNYFTDNVAISSYDLKTLPDFPAEIRAPAGTLNGVSGFQIQWGGGQILTAGEKADIMVAFNAAAFKKYAQQLKPDGILVYDPDGFDNKNCKLAQFDLAELEQFHGQKVSISMSKLTSEGLQEFELNPKEKNQNKNLFALGFLSFAIDSDMSVPREIIERRFAKNKQKLAAAIRAFEIGFHYGETTEFGISPLKLNEKAVFEAGKYRNIQGNQGIALALICASYVFDKKVMYSGYPITPASDILHELSKFKTKNLYVMQAEDEIAAAGIALGASFGGAIGVTASSGPGIDLKQETISLAHSAELPLVIIDVQRAGPSTGMPTKIEQSDFETAMYGRHGECPVPILAIKSPSLAYQTTLEAIAIALEFQTPVFLMSDVSIANSSEPWQIPTIEKKSIAVHHASNRNEYFVKQQPIMGAEGKQFILGGLEKDYETGKISYDAKNHQKMTKVRQAKIDAISSKIPQLQLEQESAPTGTLIVSWGSTYGAVQSAFLKIKEEYPSKKIGHLHLEWLNPLPSNFESIVSGYDQMIVAELNMGQVAQYLKTKTTKPIHKITKVEGLPFFTDELKEKILEII
jgi:2-oxoglutarate ferredoxin oxidoreductase subunit alpha